MHQNRRRKKRPNYGLRTVEVIRGANGFGFTISGQQPCILSCIVSNSPADQAGLRAGDFLISVNGISVSKMAHDTVVGLIGSCVDPIQMTIAENYFSDSSDDEFECGRIVSRKPKYTNKLRQYRRVHKAAVSHQQPQNNKLNGTRPNNNNNSNYFEEKPSPAKEAEAFNVSMPMEDEAGPIEYKALVGYLGTIEMPKQLLPSSRLQTVCNCIKKLRQEKRAPSVVLMTVLPTCLTLKNASNHIIAIYPTNRVVYAGSVADKESRYFGLVTSAINDNIAKEKNNLEEVAISNSCHVFMVDSKIVDHRRHIARAEQFKVTCTLDPVTGCCLEFPQNALYIVNLVQTMYKLQNDESIRDQNNHDVANSPQPSASSNSDSGIGYRDDCGNVSDRILVVEFPTYRPLPTVNGTKRPQAIDGALHSFDNNLNNVRAFQNQYETNKLTCRALPDSVIKSCNVDTGQVVLECPVDVQEQEEPGGGRSNILNIFRVPFECKKSRKLAKMAGSCENIDERRKSAFGLSKTNNYSCEELGNVELYGDDKLAYGSLQDLSEMKNRREFRNIAQSEPDVRIQRNCGGNMCDQNGDGIGTAGTGVKQAGLEAVGAWATSFEKLLDDPVGLHAFAEFLKKEFSAENIYFWTACERYRRIAAPAERHLEAQRIFNQHLGGGAVEAVNVDARGRQAAEHGLAAADGDIFDIAQKQIFNLMKFDSYPRFLKSQLYKQCLAGDAWTPPSVDPRLSLYAVAPLSATPSKLKKSLSNAEDRRRKSLLPWHRKNVGNQRSKSRERNESLATQKSWDGSEDTRRLMGGGDMHSSHSSLTSLDLAVGQESAGRQEESRTALCRVLLSNGSTTVVQIKDNESVQLLIDRLLEKRGLTYSSYEVFTNKHPKALDINESSLKLAGCEVTIERRVVFKLDLPNKKIISVKSKYTKIIVDVLRPILHKYKFSLDQVTVSKGGYLVDVNLPVTTIDNARLCVQLKEEPAPSGNDHPLIKLSNAKISKLEEITNKVFEGILQEKSDVEAFKPAAKSDKGSVKSEDWGSENSSGLLGKFLRRDSAMHDKKKVAACPRPKPINEQRDETGPESIHKKPLIAKLKAGANKLHVSTCSESDELVEGLTRAQRRLEDQRGTEINFELPDFLKDKDRSACAQSKVAFTKNLRHDGGATVAPNYENQNVVASPRQLSSSPKIVVCTERNGNAAGAILHKGGPRAEPPPLPPKPKIVPIKPPNWGNPGFYKAKDVPLEKHAAEMFLEQPSSSFV